MIPRVIAVVVVILFLGTWLSYRRPGVVDVVDSLVPELFGAAIIILIVELVIAARDRRRDRRFSQVASRRIARAADSLVGTWKRVILGSLAVPPNEGVDVFSKDVVREFAEYFDLTAQSDFYRPTNWGYRLSWLLNEEKRAMMEAISLYGVFMEPDVVELAESVSEDRFVQLFYLYPNAADALRVIQGRNVNFKLKADEAVSYFQLLCKLQERSSLDLEKSRRMRMYVGKTGRSIVGKYRRVA